MADAELPEQLDVPALVERVEGILLGGEPQYTRGDMAEQSGMSAEDIRALWRAMGFAAVADDKRVFTEADLDALRHVQQLAQVAGIDAEVMRAMTRMIGQSFARLASWQGQVVVEAVAQSPELLQDASGDRMVDLIERLTPLTAQLHEYVWRRQLGAYFQRAMTGDAGDGTAMAVGFADMAQFTAFTRRSSEAELREVLETFEAVATDVVTAHGGQIVKTIGDEVLFVADDPRAGAEIGLGLLEAAEAHEKLPELRVGLAAGPVIRRLGDVFGQTVNIASRLTSLARPDSILVDEGMHEALEGDDGYALRGLRPASVRGYHHLRSWRLRRA